MNRRGTREFRVGRGKSGKKTWMIAGYPLGKLERQYYSTGKEAEAAAEKSNVMLRRFGEQAFSMDPATCYEAARAVLLKDYDLTLAQVVDSVVAERKMEMEGHKLSEIM